MSSKPFVLFSIAPRLPEFVTGMREVQATEGRAAKFEVVVDGMPPPTITWYKGARELTESNR